MSPSSSSSCSTSQPRPAQSPSKTNSQSDRHSHAMPSPSSSSSSASSRRQPPPPQAAATPQTTSTQQQRQMHPLLPPGTRYVLFRDGKYELADETQLELLRCAKASPQSSAAAAAAAIRVECSGEIVDPAISISPPPTNSPALTIDVNNGVVGAPRRLVEARREIFVNEHRATLQVQPARLRSPPPPTRSSGVQQRQQPWDFRVYVQHHYVSETHKSPSGSSSSSSSSSSGRVLINEARSEEAQPQTGVVALRGAMRQRRRLASFFLCGVSGGSGA